MSSALKPVLSSGGPQNQSVPSQLTKPMHTQGPSATYGQPTSHMPQNLVNMPHNTPNPAHNPSNIHHTNVHSSQNHYSLNVPSAAQHYGMSSNAPASSHPIPMSNHPVQHAQSVSYSTPNKNPSFPPTYQPNLGHPPNMNPAQNLPAVPPQPAAIPSDPQEKPQSNGTPEVKSNKAEQNHISPPKDRMTPLSPEKAKLSPEKPPTPPPTSSEEASNDDKEPEINPLESSEPSLSSASTTTESLPAESVNTSANIEQVAPDASAESESTTATEEEGSPVIEEPKSEPTPAVSSDANIPSRLKEQVTPKSTMKLATTPRTPSRKSKTPKVEITDSPRTSKSEKVTTNKSPSSLKSKRTRIRTQPYQSPLPEIEIISKMTNTSTPRSKSGDEKLIIFYKNEFLAVRNSEGGFYICQAVQNIYKSSPRIRIRWLSQDKNDKSGEIYTPDFYDQTDFDCILTNLSLGRVDKGKFRLPPAEKTRTDSILQRALAVEKGDATPPSLTEEHPDGLDLSLYKEESQLKKGKAPKRKASSSLKMEKKPSIVSKSPEQAKVKKVVPKPKPKSVKKVVAKKVPVEVKKTPVTVSTPGRSERAKRRQDTPSSSKTSPVVDHKKAKVLAKVARKTAISAPKTQSPVNKSHAKSTKVTPPAAVPKPQKPTSRNQAAVVRKTKRTRK